MSEIYIVAGPPRSWTSLVAQCLHAMGVNMGPGGFVNDNRPVVDERGVVWNKGGNYACKDYHTLITKRFYLKGHQLVSEEFSVNEENIGLIQPLIDARSGIPKWGLKGTHSYAAAPVLESMGLNPRLIITRRPLEQSQASYQQRTFSDLKDGAPEFVANVRDRVEAAYAAHQGPKHVVDGEALMNDPRSTLQTLADFVGLPLTDEVVAIVDPNEWRFQ